MQGVLWGGVLALGLMYAAFLVVGWLAARKVHEGTAEELILAGRSMPLWLATMTMTATWVDGGYLLGTVEYTQSSLASGAQGGLCFGLSLILGGLFFAKRMRQLEYTTLVDPFDVRFGRRWAAVLLVPALLAEVIWSAELLVAIGATLGVMLDLELRAAVLLSAGVVTAYTMVGGMWSVAYTDAFQLSLIPIGMIAAIPFALARVGGFEAGVNLFFATQGSLALLVPPLAGNDPQWPFAHRVAWWDLTFMLILGGIPWNCYFQRVLSCQTPNKARWHSISSGVLTIALTVPPLILGMAALVYTGWTDDQRAVLDANPSMTLPMLLRTMTPYFVAILGLGAIVGAVTSSFSASILSAGSMFSWNVFRRLIAPRATVGELRNVIRGSIVLLGVSAAAMALSSLSVADLWFFTADLVYVLLFPQLLWAMFDPRANRTGSIAAFVVSLVLRVGGGLPLLGLAPLVDYPAIAGYAMGADPAAWYDAESGESLFPCRAMAAAAGLFLLPVVSRLTARWDPPKPLTGQADTSAIT